MLKNGKFSVLSTQAAGVAGKYANHFPNVQNAVYRISLTAKVTYLGNYKLKK